ncbi:MAG: RdgB/HAM1 family non-canonical purine NTP pyrophosphatase [Actinomycetota bacterium]
MMAFPARIAIASRNEHKLRELGRICRDWPVEWVTVQTHDPARFPDVEETEDTYLGNALLKARAVADALGVPAIADDSGIEVDALGGKPGPRSARYAGEGATDEQNLDALMQALRGIPSGGRVARYRCVAALAHPGGEALHTEATCEGTLMAKRRGVRGFGYDPIFVPAGWEETMAEVTDAQKDRISHRGRAFRALEALLSEGVPDSR